MFDGVTPEMTIAREEIFGPVLAAIEFADLDEAIARANDSSYGLAAAVWTKDIKKAHYVARKLQAGTVWINTYNVYDTAAPFGGYKQSGFGREMSDARARTLHAGEERLGGSEPVGAGGVGAGVPAGHALPAEADRPGCERRRGLITGPAGFAGRPASRRWPPPESGADFGVSRGSRCRRPSPCPS